jgi:hypothetical protein
VKLTVRSLFAFAGATDRDDPDGVIAPDVDNRPDFPTDFDETDISILSILWRRRR